MRSPKIKHYDYIIAGAGASGLSLLRQMMKSPLREKQILVIDISMEHRDRKTWCFWGKEHPLEPVICHSWNRLEVRAGEKVYREPLKENTYWCLRSEHFHRHVLDMARGHKNITFLESYVKGFRAENRTGYVQTGDGEFSAEWIFQSVMKTPFRQKSGTGTGTGTRLIQHFTGWEIESENELFDPATATLMDFNGNRNHGVSFFYILPFTSQRALLEYTVLSDTLLGETEYEEEIENHLRRRFGLTAGSYTIHRKETGAIPMNDREMPGYANHRTINLGIAGGVTKPTTGYTFARSCRHSEQIVKALADRNQPAAFAGSSRRYRLYDTMFLYLLKNEPEVSEMIFHQLFQKNRIERILEFLDEKTTLLQELTIFSKLPYSPFFRSLFKMKNRISPGQSGNCIREDSPDSSGPVPETGPSLPPDPCLPSE